uniref:Radical S-adenosyl methionine domain-containing protein 1, mitochondrial n=1 Tax=Paulinella chromatophora TaxID=39717 RepID=B1X3L6_PAUCH|nr:Oxygen-independent coproporphyrinogen III oxidase [Paulinella chromatophora]ACB42535.1 Oxygen-independent coproporphyrinogen III oxidase [Paulinella chromatophora]
MRKLTIIPSNLNFPPVLAPRSAYLHIPFCHRRCYYCDFAVIPLGDKADGAHSNSIQGYLELLHHEISSSIKGPPLSTVYIGGGTPSMLTSKQLEQLLEALRCHFGFAPEAELTLEMDPSTFNRRRFEGYLAAGINRMSLGVQSFEDITLTNLGRRHRWRQLQESLSWLAAAFEENGLISWNLDLIQGLPSQTLLQWKSQLEKAINFNPPHLSIYTLSIEPGTVFAWQYSQGKLALPESDETADLMELSYNFLSAVGYSQYEISNFALPGHASRHNRAYWSGAGWWGFGLGATSAPYGEIIARPRKRETYTRWLIADKLKRLEIPISGMSFDERIIVGMRRREGVALAMQAYISGVSEQALKLLLIRWKQFYDSGLILIEGERWRLSEPYGMAMSNGVLREMLVWWESSKSEKATSISTGKISQD